MDFYVYVYLDPCKKGYFVYDNIQFEYEPFYIGKGTKNRYKWHYNQIIKKLREGLKIKNTPKNQKIKSIISKGFKPIIIKIKENISDEDSQILEKNIILKIGRKNLKTGPLCNLTEGGNGGNTYNNLNEEQLKIISLKKSASMIGKNKGKTLKKETKQRISNSLKGKNRPKHSELMKGRKLTESHKNAISKSGKERYKNSPSKLKKKVAQYNKEGELIKVWDSLTEAKKGNGISSHSNIGACCNGKRKTSNKYKWKWYNDNS
jgi:hypothetical protein